MELTQFVTPTVIVALAGATIGLIVKAVRLQTKVDRQGEENKELKAEMKDTRERHFKHVADVSVHNNAEAVKEFRQALDRRLDSFDESFKDIARKLNHMAGRE